MATGKGYSWLLGVGGVAVSSRWASSTRLADAWSSAERTSFSSSARRSLFSSCSCSSLLTRSLFRAEILGSWMGCLRYVFRIATMLCLTWRPDCEREACFLKSIFSWNTTSELASRYSPNASLKFPGRGVLGNAKTRYCCL
jgi:hypothetical protein